MKQTVTFQDFKDAFRAYNRLNHFSWEGLEFMFHYLEELEQDTGTEFELDVIGICSDYCEQTPEEIIQDYGIDMEGVDTEEPEEVKAAVIDYLQDNTTYLGETEYGLIYLRF